MRAPERKIVHTYLSERTDVETHSARATSPTGRLVVSPRPGLSPGVSRETPLGVSRETDPRYALLLEALAAEPDPHTTISDPERARDLHVADSLSGLEVDDLARARRIADIGRRAGLSRAGAGGRAAGRARGPGRVVRAQDAR